MIYSNLQAGSVAETKFALNSANILMNVPLWKIKYYRKRLKSFPFAPSACCECSEILYADVRIHSRKRQIFLSFPGESLSVLPNASDFRTRMSRKGQTPPKWRARTGCVKLCCLFSGRLEILITVTWNRIEIFASDKKLHLFAPARKIYCSGRYLGCSAH